MRNEHLGYKSEIKLPAEPDSILRQNIKEARNLAIAYRRVARTFNKKALKCDEKADGWEAQLTKFRKSQE